ncbi:ABC transporter substrate-binding protein [Microbacterium betulae]|uniref:ABC transporter substrate-binding protein n=1 Tax=Microbacterium betulae TaxID=2981139 RepID=A0AA97FF64_9MICO|nr:ABC transporter substrate-binding protein [Microbacterium sp. AB]WOF22386.1 ABC transporter substrate-binding protein [Microbacterium sp. AB]
MRRTTRFRVLIGGVVGALALSGCSAGAGDGRETLVFWDQIRNEDQQAALDGLIAEFEEGHPDIDVQVEIYQAQELDSLAKNALRSQSVPDVVYAEVGTVRELFSAGLVEDLAEYEDAYGWQEKGTEAGLEWTTFSDGELYGIGIEAELSGVFYNRTLIEENGLTIPTTTDEMLAYCRQAREKGFVPYATGAGGSGWIYYFYLGLPIVNMLGPEAERAFVAHESGEWTDPEIRDALATIFEDAKDAGCFIPEMNTLDGTAAYDLLVSGKALASTPKFTGDIVQLLKDAPDEDWVFDPFPAVEGGEGRFYQQGMGSAFAINSKSEHKDAAAEFVDFWLSDDIPQRLVEEVGWIPPLTGVDPESLEVPDLLKQAVRQLVEDGDQTGVSIDLVSSSAFNDQLGRMGQETFDGQRTLDSYLEELQKAWEEDQ